MTQILVLFLFLSPFADVNHRLKPDEISAHMIFACGVAGENAMILLTDMPKTKLYHFSFRTKDFAAIEDGRVGKVKRILAVKDEFILVSTPFFGEGSVFFFSKEGIYKKSLPLNDILGASTDYSYTFFSGGPEGAIFVSYESAKKKNMAHLARMDFNVKKMTPLVEIKLSDSELMSYWVFQSKRIYFFSPLSGKIQECDANFIPKKVIRKGEPLTLANSQKPNENTPLFLKYVPKLNGVFQHADFVTFLKTNRTKEKELIRVMGKDMLVDKSINTYFMLKDSTVEVVPDQIIATYQNQLLIFDKEEGQLKLY